MKDQCCTVCYHFDTRTHFCRLNPPQPVVFFDHRTKEHKISSKFPIITLPDVDYCSKFEPENKGL